MGRGGDNWGLAGWQRGTWQGACCTTLQRREPEHCK